MVQPTGFSLVRGEGFTILGPSFNPDDLKPFESSEEVLSFIDIMLSGNLPWSAEETRQQVMFAKAHMNQDARSSWVTFEERFYREESADFNRVYEFWVNRSRHDYNMIESLGFTFVAAEIVKDTRLDLSFIRTLDERLESFNGINYAGNGAGKIQVKDDVTMLIAPGVEISVAFDAISRFEYLKFGDFPGNFYGAKTLSVREGVLVFSFDDIINQISHAGQRLTSGTLTIGQNQDPELSFAFNSRRFKSSYTLVISPSHENFSIYNKGPAHCTLCLEKKHQDKYKSS